MLIIIDHPQAHLQWYFCFVLDCLNFVTNIFQKTVKFNKVLTENARLRNEIDNLLVQRSQFNETYKALTARLDVSKQIMMNLIEQATAAYEQR